MSCRSCGLGPKPVRRTPVNPVKQTVQKTVSVRPKVEQTVAKSKPSIPTRSPKRTFATLGE